MVKTPGAVHTSQLIPRQAIGCERLSVTVGQGKQSTICSGLVVGRTKAGEGGGAWGEGGGFGWGNKSIFPLSPPPLNTEPCKERDFL